MNAEEDHAGILKGSAALNRELPEVFVQREDDPRLGFREIQEERIACAGVAGPGPNEIVAIRAKSIHMRAGGILISEQPHLCGDRISPVFVSEKARIG